MSNLSGMPVLLRSSFQRGGGYGNDGIDLARTLLERGVDLHVEPFHVGVPLPPELAVLFTKPRPPRSFKGEQFVLSITHVDPEHVSCPPMLTVAAQRNIAWTMWEFGSFAGEPWASDIKDHTQFFDDIICYDGMTERAFKELIDPEVNTHVLQGGYNASDWMPDDSTPQRDWSGTFRYVMLGQLHWRKNPFAAIDAFGLLKDKHGDAFDAELILKTNMNGLHPAMERRYPGLKIVKDSWSHAQTKNFYAKSHCLLAPSRGEGKHLPSLEAQTMGVPVIVSDCGGIMQWADPGFARIVPGELVPKDEIRNPGQVVTEVKVEDMAEAMWKMYTDRAKAKQMGERASRMIPQMCDWSKVVERLELYLSHSSPRERPLLLS